MVPELSMVFWPPSSLVLSATLVVREQDNSLYVCEDLKELFVLKCKESPRKIVLFFARYLKYCQLFKLFFNECSAFFSMIPLSLAITGLRWNGPESLCPAHLFRWWSSTPRRNCSDFCRVYEARIALARYCCQIQPQYRRAATAITIRINSISNITSITISITIFVRMEQQPQQHILIIILCHYLSIIIVISNIIREILWATKHMLANRPTPPWSFPLSMASWTTIIMAAIIITAPIIRKVIRALITNRPWVINTWVAKIYSDTLATILV